MRLIDADELKYHKFLGIQYKQIGGRRNGKTLETVNRAYQKGWNDAIDAIIDNAPTVDIPNYGGQVVPDILQGWRYEERPQGECNCSNCDYWKFSRAIINGFVDLMAAHGIESVEELEEYLHRLNPSTKEAENDTE